MAAAAVAFFSTEADSARAGAAAAGIGWGGSPAEGGGAAGGVGGVGRPGWESVGRMLAGGRSVAGRGLSAYAGGVCGVWVLFCGSAGPDGGIGEAADAGSEGVTGDGGGSGGAAGGAMTRSGWSAVFAADTCVSSEGAGSGFMSLLSAEAAESGAAPTRL
ncbi:hypothetical protein JCM9534A_47020 [Catenuloplanes indicus JCM 9534]